MFNLRMLKPWMELHEIICCRGGAEIYRYTMIGFAEDFLTRWHFEHSIFYRYLPCFHQNSTTVIKLYCLKTLKIVYFIMSVFTGLTMVFSTWFHNTLASCHPFVLYTLVTRVTTVSNHVKVTITTSWIESWFKRYYCVLFGQPTHSMIILLYYNMIYYRDVIAVFV